MYVLGKISTGDLLQCSGKYVSGNPRTSSIKSNWIDDHPTDIDSDLFIFNIDENSNEAERIFRGDDCSLIWHRSAIIGIDFTNEDIKPWIEATSDKSLITADGIDKATVTLRILNADKTLDTSFNDTITKKYVDLNELKDLELSFVNGVATHEFISLVSTYFIIPPDQLRDGGYRVESQIIIKAE